MLLVITFYLLATIFTTGTFSFNVSAVVVEPVNNAANLTNLFLEHQLVVNCEVLAKQRYEVGWSVLDNETVAIQYALNGFDPGNWFAFGFSGSNRTSLSMVGAQVFMFFYPEADGEASESGFSTRPTVRVYNISGKLPCNYELFSSGFGVCESSQQNIITVYSISQEKRTTVVQFTVPIDSFPSSSGPVPIIWASGKLNDDRNLPSSIQVHQETIEEDKWIDFFGRPTSWECSIMANSSVDSNLTVNNKFEPLVSSSVMNSTVDTNNKTVSVDRLSGSSTAGKPKVVTTTAATTTMTTTMAPTAARTTKLPEVSTSKIPSMLWPVSQCRKLMARRFEVGWEIVGDNITFQYHLLLKPGQWFAFGFSGKENATQMLGAEVFIFFMPSLGDPQTADYLTPPTLRTYKITAMMPCTASRRGVCESPRQSATLVASDMSPTGYIIARFTRPLNTAMPGDRQIKPGSTAVIWAKGQLRDNRNLPSSLVTHSEKITERMDIDFFDMSERLWDCKTMARATTVAPQTTVPAAISPVVTSTSKPTTVSNNNKSNKTNENSTNKPANEISNCKVLVPNKYEVSWKIANSTIFMQFNVVLDPGNWFSFGFSGNYKTSKMFNGDVFVFSYENAMSASLRSYKLSSTRYCNESSGLGVCPKLNQTISLESFAVLENVVTACFSRPLDTGNPQDRQFQPGPVPVIWAKGRLKNDSSLAVHSEKLRTTLWIDFFENSQNGSSCSLLQSSSVNATLATKVVERSTTTAALTTTKQAKLRAKRQATRLAWSDIPTIQTESHLVITIGPTGGDVRGYSAIQGISPADNGLAFYVNGLLAPDIQLYRNTTYYFYPLTGAEYPVYITDDPDGGYANADYNRRNKYHYYAGVDAVGQPSLIGLYCLYQSNITQSSIDQLPAYASFFNTLNLVCSPTNNRTMANYFQWTPGASTPSVVYYQSYSKQHMGGRLLVNDAPPCCVYHS